MACRCDGSPEVPIRSGDVTKELRGGHPAPGGARRTAAGYALEPGALAPTSRCALRASASQLDGGGATISAS